VRRVPAVRRAPRGETVTGREAGARGRRRLGSSHLRVGTWAAAHTTVRSRYKKKVFPLAGHDAVGHTL
jgi:hypothetical protein